MSKKITQLIILMIIMLLTSINLTGCSINSVSNEIDSVEGLEIYTIDEDYTGYTKCEEIEGVEFYYPSNYVSVGTSEQPMYMDPEILGASVNVVSSELPSTFSFEGYIDAAIIGIKDEMTVEGEVNKTYINLNGIKAARLDYTATSEEQTMTLSQIVLKKDSKAYILTIGSLKENIEELKPKMEKIIKSFR